MRSVYKALLAGITFAGVVSAAFATDIFTWKPVDLYVKRNLYIGGHLLSGVPSDGSATLTKPTIAAGTGAGTSPTITITGNDAAGQISVVAGSTPSASATIGTVTFGTAFPTNSFVVITPANVGTAALAADFYVTSTTSAFALKGGTTALTGSSTYLWNYHVLGN